tara:strand:+ start:1238 stop:2050 length:813 start_codon:yes stop_codon:yes gene_type:complete
MPTLQLSPEDGLYYELDRPSEPGKPSFVFVNPITGDLSMWQAEIGPALRAAGYGTLCYNFRGQGGSPYAKGTDLTAELIAADLKHIVEALEVERPVLVGLSIGGLYAARAYLAGCPVEALVLVNTLRRIGPRLAWMNDATLRLMAVAGPALMRDVMTPLLFGPDFLAEHRDEFLLPDTAYEPLDPDSGAYNLLTWMGKSDWDVPWNKLDCPVLVSMGPNDRIFYDADVVAALYAELPNARRVDVPEAGHMLPAEAPARFTEILLEFAAGL